MTDWRECSQSVLCECLATSLSRLLSTSDFSLSAMKCPFDELNAIIEINYELSLVFEL